MYAHVVVYIFVPDTADQMIRLVEEMLFPIVRQLPGFISCEVVRTGSDSAISISHWETRQHVQAAMESGEEWVREHAIDNVLQSAGYIGPVAFHHTADHLVVL